MIQNPLSAHDAQKKGFLSRIADWLTKKSRIEMSSHLFPEYYD